MHAKIDKEDCMFLISDEKFNQFEQLLAELDFFTWIVPVERESYQTFMMLFDIWYFISTEEMNRITHPENRMIYPYRNYFLKIIKSYQIKRYIQLALYENERLAFICALYLFKELDAFIGGKLALHEEAAADFSALQKYSENSLRPYYDSKYSAYENYPRELAILQSAVVKEVQTLHQKLKLPLGWAFEQAIDEAGKVYEAVFGLINDWGGRVP